MTKDWLEIPRQSWQNLGSKNQSDCYYKKIGLKTQKIGDDLKKALKRFKKLKKAYEGSKNHKQKSTWKGGLKLTICFSCSWWLAWIDYWTLSNERNRKEWMSRKILVRIWSTWR